MTAIPKIDCTTAEFNKQFDNTYRTLLRDKDYNNAAKFYPKIAKMSEYCDMVLYPDVEKKNSVTLKYFKALAKHRQDVVATSTEMCAFAMTWMYFAERKKLGVRPQTVRKRTKTNQMGLDFYLNKK